MNDHVVSDRTFRDAAAEKAVGKLDATSIEASSIAAAEGVSILSDNFATEKCIKHYGKGFFEANLARSGLDFHPKQNCGWRPITGFFSFIGYQIKD